MNRVLIAFVFSTIIVNAQEKCLTSEEAIHDLKKKEEELDSREKELETAKKELQDQKRALEEELKKLDEYKKEIGQMLGTVSKKDEERVTKLAETIESMSPKNIAQILMEMEQNLAYSVMTRLSTIKLSKAFNQMKPEKASKLSELLAYSKISSEKNKGEVQ